MNINRLSLSKIISLNSLLNTVTFYKNMYTSSLVSKVSRYNINLTFFINQSAIVRIELYKMFVNNFFNKDNLIIKFIITILSTDLTV